MNYLVIDLEMCKVPKLYRRNYQYANETIQIGAVLLDNEFKKIATLSQYVHPEYGVLDHFIENMTGIHNCDIKNAPKLQEAVEHLIDWIGNREYQVYAWSNSDRTQILHEIKAKNITSEKIGDFIQENRWIDYQAVFKNRYHLNRQFSLEEALCCADIEPEGKFHDGLDDAINTGYLIEKLEMNPEFQIAGYEITEMEEHLSCTIGDLFTNLQLQLA